MSKVNLECGIENLFINKLKMLGYDYIKLKNYDDMLLNLRAQLCILNNNALIKAKGKAFFSDLEFGRILDQLSGHMIYESAKVLREEFALELENGEIIYIKFLTNDPTKNLFQLTNQITMSNDYINKNRYDITLLINGLPLIQIELKKPGIEISEAVNQINRYRTFSFDRLFKFIQIFIVSNSTQTKYFANVNERGLDGSRQHILKSLVFYWTNNINKRINRLFEFADSFLTKFNITEMLTKFMIINDTEPVLIVLRPYQIYSVKQSIDRIIFMNMNGFCFGATGCGKTISSYKLATLLRDDKRIGLVFFLIDRRDLDDQTVDEYNSFEPGCVDNTDSTKALINTLKDPTKKLIITTIQKMTNAIRNKKYKSLMDSFKNKKCVFIIDECHRSQFGKMHSDIKRHFKNANYIGFTGTPIFKENKSATGKTTADIFYSGKLDACIHRYQIKDAIADGNVLKFSVEYRQSITANKLNKKNIDLKKIDDAEYCKANNINIDELYHDPERIAFVADDILKNLDRHIHPQGKDIYTAIFATDKIKTCIDYYKYMKTHNLQNKRIAAIFTCQPNENMDSINKESDKYYFEYLKECIDDYNKMFGTAFDLSSFDAYRKDIAKRLKQKELPQIDLLLVVDMFLTGFDSKPTNTLILDKNLVWHSLVQAYSRTNRVDKVTKQFGQIITYRNIKKAQDEALKLFSGDGDPNQYLVEPYEYYKTKYKKYADELRAITPTPDDAGELINEDKQRDYVLVFRKLARTLATMKTFSEFNWEDTENILDEETYMDFKSWYLTFYDQQDKKKRTGRESILADVDFHIELVRTDKINVVYILNLLKEINRKDKAEMEKSIDLILREIEHSDNEKLRCKQDVLKEFIKTKFFELGHDTDIAAAFEKYEREILKNAVDQFASENQIGKNIVLEIMNQYFSDQNSITKEIIRNQIKNLKLGLLKSTRLINNIFDFIIDMRDKFKNSEV